MANKKNNKPKKVAPPESTMSVLEEYNINLQMEMFCQYYTSPTEFFGNGVQSYAAAYNIDLTQPGAYKSCLASASNALTNRNILRRIDSLLQEGGLTDQFVDKQLLFLITQNADFNPKLGAIREYNKMKQRVVDKVEHTIAEPITRIELYDAEDHPDIIRKREAERAGKSDAAVADEEAAASSENPQG